jgi:hypothetical protein
VPVIRQVIVALADLDCVDDRVRWLKGAVDVAQIKPGITGGTVQPGWG